MTILDTLGALAHLPDDAQVTISVKKADLVAALEQRAGGPEVMTTTQAAKIHGYSSERWRRWAQAGAIEGAYQDAGGGPWHLPRTACEQHIRLLARRGRRAPMTDLSIVRSVPRGPWKTKAAAKTKAGGAP